MPNEYEMSAKRAAVEAVEKRWQAREEAQAKAKRRHSFANVAIVAAVVIVAALAVQFVLPRFGYEIADLSNAIDFLHMSDEAADEGMPKECKKYADVVSLFKGGKAAVWRDAPETIRPKTAIAGTMYHALVLSADGNYDIYEMTANGSGGVSIWLMSPFFEPKVVTTAEFRNARQGKRYFIEHAGVVYACGGLSESAVGDIRGL